MTDKYLKSEVRKAAEHLCKVLRNYSEGTMSISVRVFSRDETELIGSEEFDKCKKSFGQPDYYSIKICSCDECISTQLIGEASLVFYSEDEFGNEGIRKTITVFGEGDDEDE